MAARKVGVAERALLAAEHGEAMLTLRQAERAAAAYGRSLALLMRPAPPDEPSVETKFRRLRGAPAPPWSPKVIRFEREIRDQQDIAVELYAGFGEEPPWREASSRLQLPSIPIPTAVAHLLGIEPYALRPHKPGDLWHSRRVVVNAIEWAGVLVIRASIPDRVRGFALPHPDVPAIFVNSREDPRAQAFTIVHEFAHLLLHAAGENLEDEEEWCERYAGDVLMPKAEFADALGRLRADSPIDTATAVAVDFGVTPAAAAVRAAHLDLISWHDARTVLGRRTTRPRVSGGNGNQRKVARLSPTFTDLVLASADSSTVTLATAAQLLRTRVEHFGRLRDVLARGAEALRT